MKDIFDVSDKKIIITGGNRGNGYEISKGLIAAGAKVLRLDKEFTNVLDSDDYELDLADEESVKIFLQTVSAEHQDIYRLINNAGVSYESSNPYKDFEIFEDVLSINLRSAWLLSSQICLLMSKNKKGSIINITSLGAELGFPNNPSYQTSKAGLRQLTKAMAADWGKAGIRINNICPGYIKTAMTEKSFNNPKLNKERKDRTILNRWGKSSDLVGAAIFLISDASSYITGSDIYVDGGWSAKGL